MDQHAASQGDSRRGHVCHHPRTCWSAREIKIKIDEQRPDQGAASTGGAVDFEAEGLLDGVSDPKGREARLELLRELYSAGMSIEELRTALNEGRLALLPTELALAGEAEYTLEEISEHSGVDIALLDAQRRASGLPVSAHDDRVLGREDLEAALLFRRFMDAGLPPDGLIESARIFGHATGQIASAVRTLVGEALVQPGDTERDLGLRYAQAANDLTTQTGQILQYLFRAQLLNQLRNEVMGEVNLETGEYRGTREAAVCFVDVVGFTRLGQRVPLDDLGQVAEHLQAMAIDAVQPPARLVKTIGDAVMLVSHQVEPLLDTAIHLVGSADDRDGDVPELRAGVAFGTVLERWGDYYGAPVNLADRVTEIARPSSVLVTSPVRDAAGNRYYWSAAGRKRLKGIKGQVTLYRCRGSSRSAIHYSPVLSER